MPCKGYEPRPQQKLLLCSLAHCVYLSRPARLRRVWTSQNLLSVASLALIFCASVRYFKRRGSPAACKLPPTALKIGRGMWCTTWLNRIHDQSGVASFVKRRGSSVLSSVDHRFLFRQGTHPASEDRSTAGFRERYDVSYRRDVATHRLLDRRERVGSAI